MKYVIMLFLLALTSWLIAVVWTLFDHSKWIYIIAVQTVVLLLLIPIKIARWIREDREGADADR